MLGVVIEELTRAEEVIRAAVEGFDPATYDGDAARRLARLFGSIEKVAAAGRTLAWSRVESSGAWRTSGARSAAHEMAAETGSSVGQAMQALRAAEQLASLEQTAAAFRSGQLSVAQAAEVAAGAVEAPRAEADLLAVARSEGIVRLRDESARARATADAKAAKDRYERIHRSRFVRFFTDSEGAGRMEARMTVDSLAKIRAVVEAEAAGVLTAARKAGRRESQGAYLADALVNVVADGGSASLKAQVTVHVDAAALERGEVAPGERCEIGGAPVPVEVARAYMSEGVVSAVLRDGADIAAVAHFGRTINARLRTALLARDPQCVVPGCNETKGLEIDHVVPFAQGGPTALANLARLCRHHHRLKTLKGWTLSGGHGEWRFDPPRTPLEATGCDSTASAGTAGRSP
jgi:hypothetical protein